MAAISTAVHNGEYDFDGTKTEASVPLFVLRAEEVKNIKVSGPDEYCRYSIETLTYISLG